MEKSFNIAEKFILISHHPDRGRFLVSRQYLQYGLAGAILLDLCLAGKIELNDNRLILRSASMPADPVGAEVTGMIFESAKPRKTSFWIGKLSFSYNKFLKQILIGLEKRRVIRFEEKRLFGIFPWRKSYLVETYTRNNLIRQLKNDILVYRGDAGENISLAGLLEACRMHRIISTDREELRMIRSQLKKIMNDNRISDVVMQTIRQVQAAIIASVTAAVFASTAARH
jgi:hypothetical protein